MRYNEIRKTTLNQVEWEVKDQGISHFNPLSRP